MWYKMTQGIILLCDFVGNALNETGRFMIMCQFVSFLVKIVGSRIMRYHCTSVTDKFMSSTYTYSLCCDLVGWYS